MGKKIIIILTVAIVAWYVLFSSEEQQPLPVQSKSPAQPQQRVQQPKLPPKQEGSTLKKIGNWPFSGDGEDVVLLDNNLIRKNFVLIFDGSGSMNETRCSGNRTKVEAAKEAVSEWSVSVPESANLGLIVFDQSGLSVRLPLGLNNRDQFRQQIHAVVANNKTPLTASIDQAYQLLNAQSRRQLGYGEYSIVVVTDGVANDPGALARRVHKILSESPVMINTIGFCIETNHSLNQPGRTIYKAANDPAALRQGLQEVLAESESFDIAAFQ